MVETVDAARREDANDLRLEFLELLITISSPASGAWSLTPHPIDHCIKVSFIARDMYESA